MNDHISQSFISGVGATALVLLASACVSTPQVSGSGSGSSVAASSPGQGIDDYVLVDCKLPGQIRQLGTKMTYLAARRPVKTTKSDCAIRGGEFVLFDRSDYSSALATLLPEARGGDPIAQTYVGEIYEKGLGLATPNYAEAANWYRKAAASNHAPAQTSLGSLYERGLGVPRDKAQALDWYRKASGVTKDRLVFESELKAENERFRRELAVRNRTTASLKRKLHQTQQRIALASKGPELSALQAEHNMEKRQLKSLERDAASEVERLSKEVEAVNALQGGGKDQGGKEVSKSKNPQLGKLELVRNEQLRSMADSKRLAGPS
jgi:hypothetical protein